MLSNYLKSAIVSSIEEYVILFHNISVWFAYQLKLKYKYEEGSVVCVGYDDGIMPLRELCSGAAHALNPRKHLQRVLAGEILRELVQALPPHCRDLLIDRQLAVTPQRSRQSSGYQCGRSVSTESEAPNSRVPHH
jgi:hypothetical protein